MKTIDALIAAIALRYDLTLLTTDGDFYAVPDLKHENWLLNVGKLAPGNVIPACFWRESSGSINLDAR